MTNLAKACELSLNDWLATFPDTIPDAERSPKHEKWKKNLFNKMRDDHYHRFTTNAVKIILVAAILLTMLLSAFVFPSSRETMLNDFNIASRFKITEHNKNAVNGEIKVGYIPEGFSFDKSIDLGKQKMYRYHNLSGEFFTILKCTSSLEMDFNTEFYDSEEIMIGNIKYIYCQGNEGVNNLVWTRNDYVYRIDGTFSKDEMIRIAKTVA
jgi:hypothetical protein